VLAFGVEQIEQERGVGGLFAQRGGSPHTPPPRADNAPAITPRYIHQELATVE
jgi:hypothetical protein